jgi:uncharacterized protein (DUF4415 family)
MNEFEYKNLLRRASSLNGDYADGYRCGLHRHYKNNETSASASEYELWLLTRNEYGRGYRDGFDGNPPKPKIGRPKLPDEKRKKLHSIRLNDEYWEKYRRLGRGWLEKAIDRDTSNI